MNATDLPAPSQERTLRRLYLTLFLRGRSSRGLDRQAAPKSVFSKLALTLVFYALMGAMVFAYSRGGSFLFPFYLHAMGLLFLGMFVAGSTGEVLFNQDEAEILMHRPVSSKVLLRAKVSMLLQVCLYLTWSFNLVGLVVGTVGKSGSWLFPIVHLASTAMAALFCIGIVVLLYQVCLRWFGRERLDNLMTLMQVLLTIGLIGGTQAAPYLMGRLEKIGSLGPELWWVCLLPPAWFAGIDELATGHAGGLNWALAGTGIVATTTVVVLAFGLLANRYEVDVRSLSESQPRRPREAGKPRLLDRLIELPLISWWLRDPITRAAFRLTAAYLARDRDVKLRIYPGLAPMLLMPVMFLVQGLNAAGGFGIAISGAYLGMIPFFALNLLQFSQQWQASDVFRLSPIDGPAPFIHGAIRAVCVFLAAPAWLFVLGVIWVGTGGIGGWLMLLPGLIAMPVIALIPGALGGMVPLSRPTEEAKSAGRTGLMMLVMFSAMALGGLAIAARQMQVLGWFLAIEATVSLLVCIGLMVRIRRLRWEPIE